MIFDTLAHSVHYRGLGPRFATAFAWLEAFSPELPDGRHELEGEALFALVQSYQTKEPADRKFESHRLYADIQYIAEGHETMYYAPLAALVPQGDYHPEKDFTLYAEPGASTPLRMRPGSFAVFLPQDGHKPACVDGVAEQIKKVVMKVRL